MWRFSENLFAITITFCVLSAFLQVEGVRVHQAPAKQQAKKVKGEFL
jgi:hypothetical protein